ncbi:uncharacterized protein [Miscanthus floridulus]|uniref:uncharacterized protein n=1 Tax=Miscanthus floridulus TaxID=154761 RepID=UPI003457B707
MKSGSASAPSGGAGGLAITERQKPAPSCVAALFQMFAKRKLFSSSSKKSKLLPPVRAHKFSPGRPPVGGEKTVVAKMRPLLLDSADYSRSKTECNGTSHYPQPGQDRNCSENEMCAPGVVARLMGLSSMPANQSHQRPTKAIDSYEPGDHWNSGRQDWSGTSRSIYTSPQKQQKTGQLIDDRRHDNAGQFNTPDTRPLCPRRHAHKVASPVKSPRSMSSRNKARLIEAAVKVLEPGLQSRNRRLSWRHTYLEYPCSSSDGAPGAAAVLHNVSDQFLRDMCDVDIPRLGAHNTGATSLDNSTSDQRTEEDTFKKSIPSRRSDQNVPCQLQPEYLLFSSTEKAGFGDSVQKISNCIADANQDAPRKQLKSNISRYNAPHGSLKQNNLKQNALPAACKVADPGYVTQSKKHRSGERNMRNGAQDFISLNKRMNDSASLRSERKVQDRFGESHTSAEKKNMSTKGCRASNLHGGTSNKLKLKTGTPKAMEKDMIIAKGAGFVSEKPKPASPNCARTDLQRQPVSHNVSRGNKKSGNISFTSSSPMKVAPTLCGDNASGTGTAVQRSPVDTCPKRRSRRDCQNTSPQREIVFWEDLQGTSNVESTESVFCNQDEVKNRVILGGRAASSLFENKSCGHVTEESLSNELVKQHNSVDSAIYDNKDPYKVAHLRETRKKHADDGKGSIPSPSISRGSSKHSPTSILQSRNADDACVPGIPCNTAEATSTNSHQRETCTVAASIVQDITTERNPRCGDPNFGQHGVQPSEPDEVQDSKLKHSGEVTTTVELLLTNVRASTPLNKSEESPKAFLLRTTECALATLTTGSNSKQEDFISTAIIKDKEASALRNLALDFVWDCLDSMCSELCDSGYRSFSELLALICTEERLADRVGKEIARCGGMAGRSLDELAVGEVERAVEAGMDPMLEAVQIGAQIEQDLVQELVDEIGVDVLAR